MRRYEKYEDLPPGFETQLSKLIYNEFRVRVDKWSINNLEEAICAVVDRIAERCEVKGCPFCGGEMFPDRGELQCTKCEQKLDLTKMLEGAAC